MAEIFRICDRITVLRDGEYQGTFDRSEVSEGQLIQRMVGRDFPSRPLRVLRPDRDAAPALQVSGLGDGHWLADISFEARAGEITALAGLAGSGRTELALSIFGVRPIASGQVSLRGRPVNLGSPRDAIRAGIGYLPEDRKEAGLFLEMGVTANYGAASLERFGCWWLDDRAMAAQAATAAGQLRLTNRDARAVQDLSGGNQQKVMLARWLLVRPPVFIVDEPTRGIDVGAKREVHDLLRGLAEGGIAVILISSELPEVLALGDRMLVMREGRLVGEIPRAEATEQSLLRLAALPHPYRSQTHACA
jgi:ribose transport system ATP-binding protein